MKTPLYLKDTDDPIIERAASDFHTRMAQQGRPRRRGMSLGIGDLVMVFGSP
jgi:hypothetical protein